MELNKLQGREVELAVTYGEEIINLKYRPAIYTAEYQHKLFTREMDGDEYGVNIQAVADLVTTWDITLDGAPYPRDKASLSKLEMPLVNHLAQALYEDLGKLPARRLKT